MAKEIQLTDTTRAAAYDLWMRAPNPMVTLFKMAAANLDHFNRDYIQYTSEVAESCIDRGLWRKIHYGEYS